jgi:lysophospholipase L1-like esterase
MKHLSIFARRFAALTGGCLAALFLAGMPVALAQSSNSPTDRLITSALIGRASVSESDSKKIAEAAAAALRDEKIAPLAQQLGEARKAYVANRQKFPAERSPEVNRSYQQSLNETLKAVRAAIAEKNPDVAALLAQAGNGEKSKSKSAVVEYEGENEMDSAARNRLAVQPIKDEPGLPRVLLIGDSISIGYTLQVRALLKGKANVHRIPVNGGATEVGLANMKKWLGDGKWDVIHFNFGLHDAKFASETTQRASREQYAENLRKLVAQMKVTGAELIFATTTPVPKDGNISPTRRFDSIPERNEVAKKVMAENGVAIDDLYSVVLPVQSEIGRSNDVHFQPAGYELLAKQVAASIAAKLPKHGASLEPVPTRLEEQLVATLMGCAPVTPPGVERVTACALRVY